MNINDYNMNLSVNQITKVISTKYVYDTFNAYDLRIERSDGRIITVTLFSVGSDNIVFENKTDKDMR